MSNSGAVLDALCTPDGVFATHVVLVLAASPRADDAPVALAPRPPPPPTASRCRPQRRARLEGGGAVVAVRTARPGGLGAAAAGALHLVVGTTTKDNTAAYCVVLVYY